MDQLLHDHELLLQPLAQFTLPMLCPCQLDQIPSSCPVQRHPMEPRGCADSSMTRACVSLAQVAPSSPPERWETPFTPQQSRFLQGAADASSPALMVPRFCCIPARSRLTQPLSVLVPQICLSGELPGAAGGTEAAYSREGETRCLAPFPSSLAPGKSHAHQRRPPTRPLKSRHNWEFIFS